MPPLAASEPLGSEVRVFFAHPITILYAPICSLYQKLSRLAERL